jgi:hypothetical protein
VSNTAEYMKVLAKVMQTDSNINKEKFNKLYYMIHSEFYDYLQNSLFPYTSDVFRRCGSIMEALEPLYIFPEIVGKRCLLISSHITTNIFSLLKDFFLKHESVLFFSKINTQIPFIIVNSDKDNKIEVLNFADVRVLLTEQEFELLITESKKRKIALNKVIKYIFYETKIIEPNLCLIFDNIYRELDKIFSCVISKRIAYIEDKDIKNFEKGKLEDFSDLIISDNIVNKLDNLYLKKYSNIISNINIDYIRKEVKPVLYGFLEKFLSMEIKIKDYYENQKIKIRTILNDITGDIVRLGDKEDKTLQSLQMYEEYREKKINLESNEISEILYKIRGIITEICNDLGENYITGKQISKNIFDDIFNSIFQCENFNKDNDLEKKILSRLHSFEYDNYDLVLAYIQANSGEKVDYNVIDIKQGEWEKAKMILFILEPDNIPLHYLKEYIKILGNRCSTGKELYAKALISPDNIKKRLLQKSFDKGYKKSGLALLEKYKKGEDNINLLSLANALIPEACMIIADNKIKKYLQRKKFVDLSNKEFTYYKIAATKEYSPAIGKIVDIVFNSRFSSGFQIPANQLQNEKYKDMINNGHVICQLCRFLIDKQYQVEYYTEILGIILFSLNENLSESMNLLTKVNSGLAYYCKGNMYEFGGGVTIDLEQAINNYQKALDKGFQNWAQKRIDICYKKRDRCFHEQNRKDYYQSNRNYHSTYTETSRATIDDGCFTPGTLILMANKTYCRVEDIKIDDMVMVYDHYSGNLIKERIIANVHDNADKKEYKIITLKFEDGKSLKIVKSHILFDITENQYVWIDDKTIESYLGHEFALYVENEIKGDKLLNYSIKTQMTYYYVPISKYHLNVFAEDFLTMPPTKLTLNMFDIKNDMCYDLSIVEKVGKTSYEEIKHLISLEEYSNLPCEYLRAVIALKRCEVEDFKYVMMLFRDQSQYILYS